MTTPAAKQAVATFLDRWNQVLAHLLTGNALFEGLITDYGPECRAFINNAMDGDLVREASATVPHRSQTAKVQTNTKKSPRMLTYGQLRDEIWKIAKSYGKKLFTTTDIRRDLDQAGKRYNFKLIHQILNVSLAASIARAKKDVQPGKLIKLINFYQVRKTATGKTAAKKKVAA